MERPAPAAIRTATKYRLKRVDIEAVQWNPDTAIPRELTFWFACALTDGTLNRAGDFLKVWTRGGIKTAQPGDRILRKTSGEIDLCPQAEFFEIYEPI